MLVKEKIICYVVFMDNSKHVWRSLKYAIVKSSAKASAAEKQFKKYKTETVEEFLNRGGKIVKLPSLSEIVVNESKRTH